MEMMNYSFTMLFTVEMGLKLLAYGINNYLQDTMNMFDGSIVLVSLVELIFLSGGAKAVSAFRSVRIFRTFRVLRVTKLLRSLAFMKVIIGVLSRSLSSFVYIALLLFLFIFIYALLGRQIFAGKLNIPKFPLRSNFDSFDQALVTSFQLLTIENWNDVLLTIMQSQIPYAVSITYLISWIFVGNYSLLNLFLAILLDGFTSDDAEQDLIDAEDEMDGIDRTKKPTKVIDDFHHMNESFNMSDIEEHVQ